MHAFFAASAPLPLPHNTFQRFEWDSHLPIRSSTDYEHPRSIFAQASGLGEFCLVVLGGRLPHMSPHTTRRISALIHLFTW